MAERILPDLRTARGLGRWWPSHRNVDAQTNPAAVPRPAGQPRDHPAPKPDRHTVMCFHTLAVDNNGDPVTGTGPARGVAIYHSHLFTYSAANGEAIALQDARLAAEALFHDYPEAAQLHVYGPQRAGDPRDYSRLAAVVERPQPRQEAAA